MKGDAYTERVKTMKSPEKKVRVTIDLTAQFNQRLEQLEVLVDANSKADIIRQALQLFEYVAKRTVEGYTFRAVSRTGREENLVFFGAGPGNSAVEEDRLVNA
jgi:hypothetical protein